MRSVLAFLALLATDAAAECQPRAAVLDHLLKKYDERTVAIGLERGGKILEVVVSERQRTWTIVVIGPDGCLSYVASGEFWHRIKSIPGTDG